MSITNMFNEIRELISNKKFEELEKYQLNKPENFNWVRDVFEPYNVNQLGNNIGLIWKHGNLERKFTFKDLSDKSNQFLNYLRRNNINEKDVMFSQIPLLPAAWISYLACIKGGIIILPAAITLEVRDLVFRFKSTLPKVVLADQKNAIKIDKAEEQIDHKIPVKILTDGERKGWTNLNKVFNESTTATAANTKADDNLFYFFTSGTTGEPKIVVHTHFTYPFGSFTTSSWVGMQAGDIHYNISQPGWAKFFWSSFFAPWNMGATILSIHNEKFIPSEHLKALEDYKVNTFCAPPTALRSLILEDLSVYNFNLRECVAAGEPLNPEIIEAWKEYTNVEIRDGFGQTETTALIVNLPGKKIKYGSMGKATFLYDVVIADDEGNEVPINEEGNICVRYTKDSINGIFKTYLIQIKKLKKVFKHNLYYTGDKAYKDSDGYIWFIGRDDDVIKASDFRVGPFEVESALLEHDAVNEVAVVASPHTTRHSAIKAFVIVNESYIANDTLAKELFEYCENHLARYKIPRIIQFVETLPKTFSGKIRRVELRAQEALDKQNKSILMHEYYHDKY